MLREVALALMRFSPMVAVCEEDTVMVDVSASLRLFGGILRICHQMRQVVDAVGVSVRMSVAPTGQGAWMLAKRGRRRVLKMRSLERELDSLPYLVVPEIRRFADWFAGARVPSARRYPSPAARRFEKEVFRGVAGFVGPRLRAVAGTVRVAGCAAHVQRPRRTARPGRTCRSDSVLRASSRRAALRLAERAATRAHACERDARTRTRAARR